MLIKNIKEKLNDNIKKIRISILGFIVLFLIIVLPSSFAAVQSIKSVEIYSENLSYQNKEPGAWKVTESAKWISKYEAEITIDVESIRKVSENYMDLLFVLDTSDSMSTYKLNNVKSTLSDLVDKVLDDSNNKIGLITFNSTSKIESNLTNDKNILKSKINSIVARDATNYYAGLKSVENILKTYSKESNRDFIVVFLTDGIPNVDTPNEAAQYNYLKKQYPFITINAIQYGMGPNVINELKNISDNQFINSSSIIDSNIFEEASIPSIVFNNFNIETIINNECFSVEDKNKIKANQGNVELDKDLQKINWVLDKYKTNSKATMTVKVKLTKDDSSYIYNVLNSISISSKIGNDIENVVSNQTPIISSKYKVTYDGNFPDGCSVSGVPSVASYSVFETVGISDKKLICNGYQFKGWKITTQDVTKVNDDYFTMPEADVEIKGIWSKLDIKKSMSGKVSTGKDLYTKVQVDVNDTTKYAYKYTGDTSTFSDNEDVYIYYGAAANNNVIFANYCWKIVRTTSTGGVKLLYNGVPSGGKCNNTGDASQLTAAQMGLSSNTVAFNTQYKSHADVGYMYNTRYEYKIRSVSSGTFLMGNNFTYINGTYTLVNTKSSAINSSTISNLMNYHYTCFNTTGKCSTLNYVYFLSYSSAYYIELTGGKSIENALNEMLYNDDVNKYPSTIKQAIDYWYENNMTDYTKYLEDAVWCNNRAMYFLGCLNPNGGNMQSNMYFKSYDDVDNLTCDNMNDRFTTNMANGNGKLDYPVGLITRQEQNLAYSGVSGKSPLASGNVYWTMSPFYFLYDSARVLYVGTTGDYSTDGVSTYAGNTHGVRPAVSLQPGIEYSDGDGSVNSPYIIFYN